jgi:putative flippase GtrA
MKKRDFIFAGLIGFITAIYFVSILSDKGISEKLGALFPYRWSLLVIFPILAALGLWVAFLISKKYVFIFQLAKFLLIGALATIFDLGTLSIFISLSGISSGNYFDVFKGISFVVATAAKYFPDKFWVFRKIATSNLKKEFSQFFVVTLISFILNILVAHLIVNTLGPRFGFSPELWANFGGIFAVLVTFVWNFIGYKFIVFKE